MANTSELTQGSIDLKELNQAFDFLESNNVREFAEMYFSQAFGEWIVDFGSYSVQAKTLKEAMIKCIPESLKEQEKVSV